ncbi:Os08g0327550, partial [Oryza sativa Japonica Group]
YVGHVSTDIKLVFCEGGPTTVARYWGPHVSPRLCTAALSRCTPTKSVL